MFSMYKEQHSIIVKLQLKVHTSVFGIGVDFVFPLSQQQQQQQEQEQPHQNLSEGGALEVCNLTYKLLRGFWLSLGG